MVVWNLLQTSALGCMTMQHRRRNVLPAPDGFVDMKPGRVGTTKSKMEGTHQTGPDGDLCHCTLGFDEMHTLDVHFEAEKCLFVPRVWIVVGHVLEIYTPKACCVATQSVSPTSLALAFLLSAQWRWSCDQSHAKQSKYVRSRSDVEMSAHKAVFSLQ